MPITRLDIHGVRNLAQTSLRDLGRVNLIVGANGSGKTSFLEAVHLLGMARSFRSTKIRSVINHELDALTVYGEVSSTTGQLRRLGVSRDGSGQLDAKVDGQRIASRALLAETLPLQLIDTGSISILTQSPRYRRQFLDWGVFHVEHSFLGAWQRFQRAIKQRNTLLRRGKISDRDLAPWEQELSEAGHQIHDARSRYLELLSPGFQAIARRIAPELADLEMNYRSGWDLRLDLQSALVQSRGTDSQQGFTQIGPQRADVKILCESRAAVEVLSRGQQKLVVCALKLAQGATLAEKRGQHCVYLVDDLAAELDAPHYDSVAAELSRMGTQVFVTSIEPTSELEAWLQVEGTDRRMFHVEQGRVQASPWRN